MTPMTLDSAEKCAARIMEWVAHAGALLTGYGQSV